MPRFHRATGAAAIASTLEPGQQFQLDELRVHLSAVGGAGSLTLTVDAAAGAAFDTVLLTQDMTAVTDLHFLPELPIRLDKGDKLVVAWANASARTYGLELVWTAGR